MLNAPVTEKRAGWQTSGRGENLYLTASDDSWIGMPYIRCAREVLMRHHIPTASHEQDRVFFSADEG